MEEAEKMEKEQWGKFNKLELFSKLTKSLYELYKFCEELNDNKKATLEDNKKGYDALYDLLDENNKGRLDKCFYTVQSYKYQYKKYGEFEVNKYEDGSYRTYTGEFLLINKNKKNYLSGEVLNSTNGIIKSYIDDINNVNSSKKINKQYWAKLLKAYCKLNESKIKENDASSKCEESIKDYIALFEKFSCLAKMFFHLVTTVGNVMPWPKDYNYVPKNKELDIVQTKYQYYIGLYGRVDNTGIDKERWIKAFVEGHYLQDFVTEDMTKALEFLNLDKVHKLKDNALQNWVENIINKNNSTKDDIEKEWNLYFYRCSKAIMKRSYRILENEKIKDGILSVGQNREFEKLFFKFCDKYHVKKEVRSLMLYLRKSGQVKFLKNDYREMYKYLKKHRLNNAYRYIRKSRKELCFY